MPPTEREAAMSDAGSSDALDHADMSTEELANQETQEAARADEDRGSASHQERMDQGQSHDRSLGDRPGGRESSK